VTKENIQVQGFTFSAVAAGVKKADTERLDFGLITSEIPASAAAVTTTNLVFAAPVALTRERIAGGLCQAVLINSGNANAYTGAQGEEYARDLTGEAAAKLNTAPDMIIPMSTGVIGNQLPLQRMRAAIPGLVSGLRPDRFMDVAHAMMTTDTKPKAVMMDGEVASGPFRIAGMCKGAGMIAPNMATMLAVILTDLWVKPEDLRSLLTEAVKESFNAVTIDGDMSTNDTVLLMAGGRPHAARMPDDAKSREAFATILNTACWDLAHQIVLDGEGATKVVDVRVIGAADYASANKIARVVAESPLVKTAFHGEDPNWGRIVCAAGRAGVTFDPDKIDLSIGEVPIVRNGVLVPDDWESAAHAVMQAKEFTVTLDLKAGDATARMYTTDFSEEYVSINADYRS
jgi:glutamate N-acetyltransferase/amino-acid N-acetyltransferase